MSTDCSVRGVFADAETADDGGIHESTQQVCRSSGWPSFVAAASSVRAQSQYIGYVYPAGGQQGTTFPIRLGGQGLVHASDLVVSGEGVSVRLVDYYRVMSNEELGLLSQQLNELQKKETTLDDVMAAKMAWFEFPAPIGPV